MFYAMSGNDLSAIVPDLNTTVSIGIARVEEAGWLGDPNSQHEAILDDNERERRSRLRFAHDRNLFTLAHLLLRVELSRHAGIAPAQWTFVRGPHGKPALAPALMAVHGLHFSLSHAGGMAACAVTRIGEVGVDVEPLDGNIDTDALATIALTADEQAAIADLDPQARRKRFLTLWTLKEAYLKARGTGLTQSMQQCVFRLGHDGRGPPQLAHAGDDNGRWAFDTSAQERAIVSVAVVGSPAGGVSFRYRYSRI